MYVKYIFFNTVKARLSPWFFKHKTFKQVFKYILYPILN